MDSTTPDESALLAHHYQIGELIERGPLSVIHRAVHRTTQVPYSIKTIDIQRYETNTGLGRQEVDAEIELCASLKHKFICELKDVITGDQSVHLVFEYLDGADICFEIVKRAGSGFVYSEAVISHYMRQLLQSLEYLHDNNIVHRDIRPHNVNLASPDNSAPLKLCGFGVSIKLNEQKLNCKGGKVGVPQFMAPEVVEGLDYGTKIDMWSAGVVLYILLSGKLPFTGSTEEIYEKIREGSYQCQTGSWGLISGSVKDLLRKMLTNDPSVRISAAEALEHEWIRDREHCAPRRHMQDTVENIRKYNEGRKLKSSILAAVNTDKWKILQNSPSTYLNGDAPGGDSCHPDGCTRAVAKPMANDLIGAHKILCSLDTIASLSEPNNSYAEPKQAINDKSFVSLLSKGDNDRKRRYSLISQLIKDEAEHLAQLYDKISQLKCGPVTSETEASSLKRDVIATIDSLLGPSAESIELRQLLLANDLTSCLQAHDVIVSEVCDEDRTAQPNTSTTPNNINTTPPPVPYSYLNGGVLPLGASKAGTSTEEFVPCLGEDDDDLMDTVSRVRLVQFQKDTEEPMGITLKVTEDGRCFVARIMHGGMIHRQATLHVGDEIREINGISVGHRSVETLQQMLRDARGQVTFKIVPSYRSAPPACEIFVRAQFDYDPAQDDLIPCPQAGVPFKTGDILQVISKDDHNWWQARFISCFPSLGGSLQSTSGTQGAIAGLIPSPELQEWRTACLAMERAKDHSHCMWFNRKKKYYTTKYLQKHSALFDQLDLVTYEEVMRLSQYRRKTLVLLGAHGVGRRHIKNTLIHRHPNRFAYPIPHTTRPPRKDEVDGKHYFFVSNDQMMSDIQNNEYLEYGTHEESMYGTKLETIRNIHKSGKIAILDVEPQALKVLRTAEYSPFVVFIAAPNLQGLQDPDGSLERLLRESEILRQAFGHLFDYIIVNNDIDDTITQLERIVEKLPACPQWLPVSWVY